MPRARNWVLTDAAADVWVESFHLSSRDFAESFAASWSVTKRTLRAGMSDGVDVIEVNNGVLSFAVLPTRGMGVWRGQCKGLDLGWTAPHAGPVHPKYVNLLDRGGMGWLSGFNEWICRCGLSSNGPPGMDPQTQEYLTLHGRIANLPAHHVEVRVEADPPHEITIVGEIDEAALFCPQLRLTTSISTTPGASQLTIQDMVQNLRHESTELELLYHCQFGPPFLEAGSEVHLPIQEAAPKNARAAEGMSDLHKFLGPTLGFVEQVYFIEPLADAAGQTIALLHNAEANLGVSMTWSKPELPRFVLWKNTAAPEDGYVVGLEPATNFPNFRAFERRHERVITLPSRGFYTSSFTLEVHTSAVSVAGVLEQIDRIQAGRRPVLHAAPKPEWCL